MSCNPSQVGDIDKCSNQQGNALFNYWCKNNCPVSYQRILNNNTVDGISTLEYNSTSSAQVQDQINNLFNNYLKTNSITNDVASSQYSNFQNTLLSLCLDPSLPGGCDKFLSNFCSSYKREDILNNQTIIDFCGCYVSPDENYLKYTNNSACDPLCHRSLTVQKADSEGNFLSCPQNVCVIDDVTINTANSTLKGRANITNICPYCPNGCICIISGQNITNTLSKVGIGSNINQYCGKNSVCLIEDNSGNILNDGSCSDINQALNINIPSFPPISIIIIFLFFILMIFGLFLSIRKYNTKKIMRK